MRLSGLVVRLSSLGMGLSGLWVRFSGLWVRFSGLGMGLSGLGMRLSGLGMRFSSDWSCSVLTYTMCPSSIQQMQMYVSNARGISEEGPLNAYDRQFVKLDLNQLFKVPRPSLWTCCSVCVVCRVLCECAYHRYFVVENIYFSLFWLIPATYMYYSRHTVCEMNWLYITWLIEVDFFLGSTWTYSLEYSSKHRVKQISIIILAGGRMHRLCIAILFLKGPVLLLLTITPYFYNPMEEDYWVVQLLHRQEKGSWKYQKQY